MPIARETLKSMIRDFGGFELTDEELDLMQPELDGYLKEIEELRALDLSGIMSSRLLRVDEGGQPNV